MEIKFTKEQYENLLKLAYLGNWMINAIRTDDKIEKYDDIAHYIYSFAKDVGLEKYIEYDTEMNQFFPTMQFEEDTDIHQYIDDYEAENFWSELIDRLARRDLIKEYGEDAVRKMSFEVILEKEQPFIEKYEREFEEFGIERLEVKDRL